MRRKFGCVDIFFAALTVIVTTVAAAPADAQTSDPQSCERLSALHLSGATIRVAQTVAAGAFTLPAVRDGDSAPLVNPVVFQRLPAFCRVAATLRPSSDSHINIEVWMPTAGWNGKFEAVGNGGWAGRINYALYDESLSAEVQRGYATASTDTGHVGEADFDASFALGHPEQVVDFGYRAVHEMTIAAKAIVEAYYQRPPTRSYWKGCSTGGRQGLMEAQRYPSDYDGIIAGAPANDWTHLMTKGLWNFLAEANNPATTLPREKAAVLHAAVINACDALDGVKDGIIEDPTRCRFDPMTLACKGEDRPDCLTAAQLEGVRTMYEPAKNPRTGADIFPGFERGSELSWGVFRGMKPDYFTNVVFADPHWDFTTFDFDRGVALADKRDDGVINAVDPNLRPFFSRGGKLLLYHGWSDPGIAPRNTIQYYESVARAVGSETVAGSMRLFMVPGMVHCGMSGSEGANEFDTVAALDRWVEQQQPPVRFVASHRPRAGVADDRTHALCPYPQVAVYGGSGSITDAANFVCRVP